MRSGTSRAVHRVGLALAGLALAVALTGAAAAQDAYDFVEPDWGLDFLHAGYADQGPTYVEIMGSGACVLDYDGDGWEDVFLVNSKYADETAQAAMDPRSALFRNLEGAGFQRVAGALDLSFWGLGCAAGDYDSDGDPDVAVAGWGGTLLYRNDGGGAFANVTDEAGVFHPTCGDDPCFSHSLAFLDYDKDADLDLYVVNYNQWDGMGIAIPLAYPGQCNVMWRNNGDGSFTNVSAETRTMDCGLNHLALAIADVDGNGYQDIFIASDETVDSLLMNNGDGTFTERAAEAGVDDRRGGMGASWGDYDGDGRYDLVITHFEGERFALYRQTGDLVFEDVAGEAGLELTRDFVGWATEFQDYDLDGDLDIFVVNGHVNVTYSEAIGYGQRNLVFRNDGSNGFVDVSEEVWHAAPSLGVSRGLATADFDRDGYLDLVVVNNANESAEVWRSTRGPNNWLALRLAGGAGMDPHALGAKVTVESIGRDPITREVVATHGYLGLSSRDLRFGMGDAAKADRVVVAWPNGTTQEFADVPTNRLLELSPGGALTPLATRPIATGPTGPIDANRVDPVRLLGGVAEGSPAAATARWTVEGATYEADAASHTFAALGAHVAEFRVEDADGHWDTVEVAVTVVNLPPEARIDAPAEAGRFVPVAFGGALSADRDGTIVNWTWTVGGATYWGEAVEHEFTTLGDHEVTLTVEDADGANATATAIVSVVELPPIAVAGRDIVGSPDSTFTLDGSASSDPDGDVVTWRWDFGDGTTAEGATASKRFETEGVHTVTLTVTDDDGLAATDSLTVTADADYAAPVPAPGADREATRGAVVVFDGSASHDPDGAVVRWEWEFGDGAAAEGAVVEHAYDALGTFVVNLTVTDDSGGWVTGSLNVTVVNALPIVDAGGTLQQEGLAPVTLTATGSDGDGRIVSWRWDFGDGATAEGATVTHAFADYGRHVVTVTATDDDGGATTVEKTVWLYARPVAAPGPARTGDRVTDVPFDGSASKDADGVVVAWRWDFGDGSECTIRDQTGPEPGCGRSAEGREVAHRYSALGTYAVTLTVTDDDGFAASATTTVTVVNLPPVARVDGYALANVDQRLEWRGDASHDPDGAVVAWSWTLGDGATAHGPAAAHAYAATGNPVLRLTVTDDEGATASAEWPVEVVDRLDVAVAMDREVYGPTEAPRGAAVVRFANGLPAAGAAVDVASTYRLTGPEGAGLPRTSLYALRLNGTTDADGRLEFEMPTPLWPRAAPAPLAASVATGLLVSPAAGGSWGHYRVVATASWTTNGGEGETRYEVRLMPPPPPDALSGDT